VRGGRRDGRRRVVPVVIVLVLLLVVVPVLPSLRPGVRRAHVVVVVAPVIVVVVVAVGAVDLVRRQQKQHSLGDVPAKGVEKMRLIGRGRVVMVAMPGVEGEERRVRDEHGSNLKTTTHMLH